ncbi:hypothetical protein SEUCBS139899_006478 [Sporothrix eucalyptigena]
MAERPDVVQALAQSNWPVHIFDPSRLGAHPAMKSERASRAKKVPELTDRQVEALRVVSTVAAKNSLQLDTKPGDLVFVNNWSVLHSRSAYEDADFDNDAHTSTRRHLLRLWIRNSQLGWKIPESMRAPWETAFGYTDEGYMSGDHDRIVAQFKYAIVPETSYKPARYTTGSAAFAIVDSDSESDSDSE